MVTISRAEYEQFQAQSGRIAELEQQVSVLMEALRLARHKRFGASSEKTDESVMDDMSREEFDMDYSGYVIEHFPEFEREHPRLSRRFTDTIDRTYSTCSWMTDDAFQYAFGDAVDTFLGEAPTADIY